MKTRIAEQVERILREVTTPQELLEIEKVVGEVKGRIEPIAEGITEAERVIREAKGKVALEPTKGFWEEKTPCWEMTHCPEMIRNECPAFTYQTLPCWKIEGTYCKLDDYGARGDDTGICQVCRVYKKYGAGEPIELELVGRGINARVRSVEDLVEKRL
jgi:hypothetical protein